MTPFGRLAIALCATAALLPASGRGQHITIDGSLSPGRTLVGPNYTIGANLGKQVGGNLFQSFGIFGLSSGETATFTGPATVANVIGRVTGGNPSSIDGAIKSSIAGANVYLINPAGIVFGPNATVNVSGGFHAATADYLKTADGARFLATNPGGSTLSAAPPAAFGFLNAAPPAITVSGSRFGIGNGQTLGLAGGTISISGATLTAPSGAIYVTSVAGTGEVPLAPGDVSTVTGHGIVTITNQSTLDVSDRNGMTSGGSVFIGGGSIAIDNSIVDADNFGAGPGGKIVLRGDDAITLSNGANIQGNSESSGTAPNIAVSAANLTLDQSNIASGSSGVGAGGNIAVDVRGNLTVEDGAFISAATIGNGAGGTVTVSAGTLTVSGASQIDSATAGAGNAGDVIVNARSAFIGSGGIIQAATFGPGNAGKVEMSVADLLTIMGQPSNTSFITGIGTVADPSATGNAGTVNVTAGSLSIGGFEGEISSSTVGAGNAGNVSVDVAGPIVITGPSGTFPTGIAAFAKSTQGITTGAAGTVRVTADSLSIMQGGQISSATAGPGNGGDVAIAASSDVVLSGFGPEISASSTGGGSAGAITVSAPNLTLQNGASISTQAAIANGGNITLSVGDFLYLLDSKVTTSVLGASGNGGNITIDPQRLVLNHSNIIAQAVAGHGGNITIAAGDFLRSDDSVVSASSQLGIAGTVTISGQETALNGSLVVLPSELRKAIEVLRNSCAARSALPRSSLVQGGRGGLLQDPGAAIPAVYLADRDARPAAPHAMRGARQPATQFVTLDLTTRCD